MSQCTDYETKVIIDGNSIIDGIKGGLLEGGIPRMLKSTVWVSDVPVGEEFEHDGYVLRRLSISFIDEDGDVYAVNDEDELFLLPPETDVTVMRAGVRLGSIPFGSPFEYKGGDYIRLACNSVLSSAGGRAWGGNILDGSVIELQLDTLVVSINEEELF